MTKPAILRREFARFKGRSMSGINDSTVPGRKTMEEAGVIRSVENRALTTYELGLLASLIVDEPDHYTVLGVGPDASDEDIRAAYCIAVEYFHPLKSRQLTESDSVMHWTLSSAFVRIEEAFVTLSNHRRRQIYDDKLVRPTTLISERLAISPGFGWSESWKERSLVYRRQQFDKKSSLDEIEHNRHSAVDIARERRRVQRVSVSVPMRVTLARQWQELTETEDASPLGIRFHLSRQVEPGSRLRLEMPFPKQLRTHSHDDQLYVVSAFVVDVSRDGRKWKVLAEFV